MNSQEHSKKIFQNYDMIFDRSYYPDFEIHQGTYIPKDSKPCICLSKEHYENCCKSKIEEAINLRKTNPEEACKKLIDQYNRKNKKLLSFRTEEKSISKKNISYCAAQNIFGDCDNHKIRHSHTLAKGNVLKHLKNKGGLIRFNDHIILNEDKINAKSFDEHFEIVKDNKASVTVSFCKKHDEELFAHIEKDGNETFENSIIQNLEYSLKAITFEIYYKIMNIKYLSNLVKENKLVVTKSDGSFNNFFEDYYNNVEEIFKLYPIMIDLLRECKLNCVSRSAYGSCS